MYCALPVARGGGVLAPVPGGGGWVSGYYRHKRPHCTVISGVSGQVCLGVPGSRVRGGGRGLERGGLAGCITGFTPNKYVTHNGIQVQRLMH